MRVRHTLEETFERAPRKGRSPCNASGMMRRENDCLSAEELAAFVDGNLGRRQRERAIRHLASCERCYEWCSAALRLPEGRAIPAVLPLTEYKRTRPAFYPVAASVALLVLAALAFLVWSPRHGPGKPSPPEPSRMAGGRVGHRPPAESRRPDQMPPGDGSSRPVGRGDQAGTEGPVTGPFEPPVVPSSMDMAALVAASPLALQKPPSPFSPPQGAYGFGESLSAAQCSFRFGVYATDLDVSVGLNDQKGGLAALAGIVEVMRSCEPLLGPVNASVSDCEAARRSVQGGGSLALLQIPARQARALAERKGDRVMIQLGSWAEGGKMASALGVQDLRNRRPSKDLGRQLQVRDAPKGAIEALQRIEAICAKGQLESPDFAALEESFNQILLVLW